MSNPRQVLVVGASRGIGKGLVQQLAQNPNNQVIATVRKPVDFGLPNVKAIILDQSSTDSVAAAAAQVAELDTLIVNGAIGLDEKVLSVSEERFQEYLNTNVLGVWRVVRAFLPALRARKTRQIVVISSVSGSNTKQINAKFGFLGPYSVTKAADNNLMVQFHNELHSQEGFTVVPINPGWVATDMGNLGGEGAMPVSKSVSSILKIINGLTLEDSAKFFDYDGSILPW